MGHVVSKDGIQVDPQKTDAVQTFPVPKSKTDVKSFLGLCSYYRRFVKNFANIAAPLNALLGKDCEFQWSQECEVAFQMLKDCLTSAPVLAYPDMGKSFILSTDASGSAISYILGQVDCNNRETVISYGGRALRKGEQKWSISVRECLALVEGVKAFHPYLANASFTVYTDHIALQWLQSIKQASGRLGR